VPVALVSVAYPHPLPDPSFATILSILPLMCWWCLLRIYDISREVLVVVPLAFVVIDVAGRGGCRRYSSHDDDGPRIFRGGRRFAASAVECVFVVY
jgi:hypothetical protein